jgi:hypothetical protein
LFTCINIPYFDFRTFENYVEVGVAAEGVAKKSTGKEINTGAGREHQVIVKDCIFILHLLITRLFL